MDRRVENQKMNRVNSVLALAVFFVFLLSSIPVVRAQIRPGYAPDYFGGNFRYIYYEGDPFSYEINGWVDGTSNILSITLTTEYQPVELLYVSMPDWEITTSTGEHHGAYFFPPLWQNTTGWDLGQVLTFRPSGPNFTIIEDYIHTHPHGDFNSWVVDYSLNESDHIHSETMRYDSATGILLHFLNYSMTPTWNDINGFEFSDLNLLDLGDGSTLPFSLDSYLMIGIASEIVCLSLLVYALKHKT
ncbi:MAG: hypothetical protein ACFFAY_14475 [Promethearchaeota archaeon]